MIKSVNTKNTASFLLIAIAITVHIQISLFAQGNYLGLRISLADFLLPFAGLFVLFSLITKTTRWPEWSNKYTPYLLFSLLGILTIALINGYYYIGGWSSWAYINKFSGFMVLMSYFYLAGWISTNFKQDHLLDSFIRTFCTIFIITLIISLADTAQERFSGYSLWVGEFPWDAFLANRNVYMIAAVFSIVFLLTYSLHNKQFLPSWLSTILWVALPTFALYNASRTGWIIGPIILLAYALKAPKKFFKEIAPLLVIGIVSAFLILNFISHGEVKKNRQYKHLAAVLEQTSTPKEIEYFGDQKRLIALEDGLELYQQSNPLIGAGLGTFKSFQIQKHGEYICVIDWSSLWLLTETGILGLTGFSAFFLLCLCVLYKKGFKENSPFHKAMFFFLILMICISFLHELLYTRFLWFALGLSMGTRAPQKQD